MGLVESSQSSGRSETMANPELYQSALKLRASTAACPPPHHVDWGCNGFEGSAKNLMCGKGGGNKRWIYVELQRGRACLPWIRNLLWYEEGAKMHNMDGRLVIVKE